MPVSLKIVSFKGQPYDHNEAVVIGRDGGTIGRQDSCDLALPDKEKVVSRHHANISYDNDTFILSDTSLGGTYVDNNPTPINNASITLFDGMLLRMGDYEILVNILPESAEASTDFPGFNEQQTPAESDLNPFGEENALLNLSGNGSQADSGFHENPFASEDEDNPFLTDSDQQEDFVPSTESNQNFSALHDSFIPPEPTGERHANDEIPEDFNFEELFNLEPATEHAAEPTEADYFKNQDNALLDGGDAGQTEDALLAPDDTASSDAVSAVDVPQVSPPRSRDSSSGLFQAFLQGAGLQSTDFESARQQDIIRRVGSMFRQFTESTVAVLRSRAEFKSLFRVSVTTIKKTDNNPLKFSVTTDEALRHLMNDGQGGFKKSVDAIDEGFQDILNHQMAIQAGIQASLLEILKQFDPNRIEKQYEEGLVLNKKAKCWDKYCEIYARLSENAVDDFYGDAFADAYEQQMKQIMSVKHNNN